MMVWGGGGTVSKREKVVYTKDVQFCSPSNIRWLIFSLKKPGHILPSFD